MPDLRTTLIVLAAVSAFGLHGQGAPNGPISTATGMEREPQAASQKSQEEPGSRPTADEILRELRNREPGREVIPPASWAGGAPPLDKPKLLPEGTAVVDVPGHVERDGEWWVFVFDIAAVKARYGFEAATDRIKLLPNSALEGLVRMTRASTSPPAFEITGEATVYRGANYLLIRSIMRGRRSDMPADQLARPDASALAADQPSTPDSQATKPSEAADRNGPALPAANKAAVSQPSRPGAVPANASAEDVLEQMKQLTPAGGPLPADRAGEGALGNESLGDEFSAISAEIFEGTPVIRRTGRIVPQGDWWAFAFDSDHGEEAEQPLRLLPNQSLQFMVDLHERNPAGLVFTVSGEVTEFGGRNYLLARAVTRRLDLGNLRR